MVRMFYGGGKPQSPSHALPVTAFTKKNALNPRGGFECTHALMREKLLIYQSKSGLPPGMLVHSLGSEESAEILKRLHIDICCLQEVIWNGKGAKLIGKGISYYGLVLKVKLRMKCYCCKLVSGEGKKRLERSMKGSRKGKLL